MELNGTQPNWQKWIRFQSSETEKNNKVLFILSPPGGAPGHCHKTRSIFTHFMREATKNKNLRWLVIADDDTLLGVSKLVNLIGCYDDIDDSLKWPVALGQRYGRYYAVHQMQGQTKSSKIYELGNFAKIEVARQGDPNRVLHS